MKLRLLLIVLVVFSIVACKNSKKTTDYPSIQKTNAEAGNAVAEVKQVENEENVNEEVSAEDQQKKAEEIERHHPYIADDVFFGMYRSACFGQCPVYNIDIDVTGHAVLEGKQFFDYEGFYETTLTSEQMKTILSNAQSKGYFECEHVYDASVSDVPSTLTILRSDDGVHWVYNRFNAPEGLRVFEREMDALIRTLNWTSFDPKKSK